MWSRKELKEKSKQSFKKNYWKCVLVSLILSFILGGFGSGSGVSTGQNNADHMKESISEMNIGSDNLDSNISDIENHVDNVKNDFDTKVIMVIIIVVIVCIIIVLAIAIPLQVFLINPLLVGCRKYYRTNLNQTSQIKEIGYAFDHNFLNVAKIMFFKDLYTFLWTLLFIIPGIIKSYEYRMIPYIIADNTEITTAEAFAKSKEMMTGNKWNAFVLDLSFLGWHLLNICTLGILGIFYLNPYVHQTDAALYQMLKTGSLEEQTEDIINI